MAPTLHVRPYTSNRRSRLARDLRRILINIYDKEQQPLGTTKPLQRNWMRNATALHNRFSLQVGTRSVGCLTKLLEPTFNEAQLEEHFLQREYDINLCEKDNGAALADGVKIAILLNKTKGALQQHPPLRAGQITNYNEIRAVILDYYKAISPVSRLQQQSLLLQL